MDRQELAAEPPPQLSKRLAQIPGYVWDETTEPFHSSYDNWHVFGLRKISDHHRLSKQSAALQQSSPARAQSPSGSADSTNRPNQSSNSDQGEHGSEAAAKAEALAEGFLPVVARISTHVLRLEREFHLCKTLIQTIDKNCRHTVRPIELTWLPRLPDDPGPIVVSIFESPGRNYVKDLLSLRSPQYRNSASHSSSENVGAGENGADGGEERMSVQVFLDFAVGACECLELLHNGHKIVHGELRGDAFHFNQSTGLVKLINFGSGPRSFENGLTSTGWSSLSREIGVKDKLQYIAPEQTGRMPAEPDSRTDIYSLGVLFWTLLTAQPAFDGDTPMDVMQSVLSRRIPPVTSKRPEVPDALSNIIQRMTHKKIDQRYHSVLGLKYDLKTFRRILVNGDTKALGNFEIGTRDVSSFFKLPTTMVGRQEEHAQILQILERSSKRHGYVGTSKNGLYSISSGSSISDPRNDVLEFGDGSSDTTSSHGGDDGAALSGLGPSLMPSSQGICESIPEVPSSRPSASSTGKISTDSLDDVRPSSIPSGSLGRASLSDRSSSLAKRSYGSKFRRRGLCEVITITGAAGLGKSCLAQSVHAEARRLGYVASAKFDNSKGSPFEPVLKLMSSLFRQIFSEADISTEFHTSLRAKIRPIWGVLHTMLDLPEWVIGFSSSRASSSRHGSSIGTSTNGSSIGTPPLRPQIPTIGGTIPSATNDLMLSSRSMRFINLFLDVLRTLTAHKFICLCLDDLHSADEESLDMISKIVSSRIRLVLIVTLRPGAFSNPKLRGIFDSDHAAITNIELAPLSEDDIVEYVSTTLHRPADYVFPLASVIQEKSNGNPFMLREMLDTCYRKNCVWYSWQETSWEYDLDKVFSEFQVEQYGQQLSGDFVARRLRELPRPARTILAWASLLGHTFSFALIQKLMSGEFASEDEAMGEPLTTPVFLVADEDIVDGLQAAIGAHVLIADEDEDHFRFSHDRYTTAAATLRDPSALQKMHYMIAQALMKYSEMDDRTLYSRCQHICFAVNLIRERVPARRHFRDLLVQAATKASESGAKAAALYYYSHCLELLQSEPWNDSLSDVSYQETLQLYNRAAECHLYQGLLPEALELLHQTFKHAKDVVDKTRSWVLQSRVFTQSGDTFATFQALRNCLADLGLVLTEMTWDDCDSWFHKLKTKLQDMDLSHALMAQESQDRNLLALASCLVEIQGVAWWTDPLLFYQVTLHAVSIHLDQGLYPQVGLCYTHLASICCSRFSMIEFGVRMGEFSHELLSRFTYHSEVFFRGHISQCMLVSHFTKHCQKQRSTLEAALDTTAEDKTLTLTVLGAVAVCKLYCSEDMAEIEGFCISYGEEIFAWSKDFRGGVFLMAVQQVCRALQGKTNYESPKEVCNDENHNSETYMAEIQTALSKPERALQNYQSFLIMPLYFFGHLAQAVRLGESMLQNLNSLWSMRQHRGVLLYLGLAKISLARSQARSSEAKLETLRFVRDLRDKIRAWGAVNEINYAVWSSLLSAEISDFEGDYESALGNYESCLDHAQLQHFVLEEALGHELLAEFFLRRGSRRAGRSAIRDAIATYNRISATGKAKHLTEKHLALLGGAKSLNKVDTGCQTDFSENTTYRLEQNERQTTHNLGQETSQDRTRAWLNPSFAAEEVKNDQSLSGLGLDMIDLTSILESSQVLSSELHVDRLLAKMTDIILETTGGLSDLVAIVTEDGDSWSIKAVGDPENGVTSYPDGRPLNAVEGQFSSQVILYVLRFKEPVFVQNLMEDERFSNVSEAYLAKNPIGKSIIALPIVHTDSLLGALYLEGQPNSFTERNLTVLRLLVNQIGISIANALLFKRIERVSASNLSMIESQKRALSQAREAEKKAKLAEAEAMRNVRLKEEAARAKSMFLANVSHELRTPLNGVIGMSELLKGTALNEEQSGYADSIRVCADTLLTVINDILDFSKLEAGKMILLNIPLNLHESISEVVRALSYTNLERGLETHEEFNLDRKLLVMGDPVRLHQIFMNLLSNAYKFTPSGSVTVRATTDYETEDSLTVTCSVSDTGIGITSDQLSRLFQPFSQADSSTARSYGGSGLGLSICKAMIENVLNGKIWLESSPGVGTTVYFTLTFSKAPKDALAKGEHLTGKETDPMAIYSPPASAPPVSDPFAPTIDLSQIPREKIRICIAEDNPLNQKIALSFVQKLGFKCDAYNDGQQALEALRERAAKGADEAYHLVLMDVQMPVLDGYEATKLIRQDKMPLVRGVLVIAMTASAIRGDREKCLEAGMNDYLAKPVRAQVLKTMLEQYLGQKPEDIPDLPKAAKNMANSAASQVETSKQ
ncbi:hypothetical protein L228DRAFT_265722 [Xylona heveae TC161]|uniref:histidine kinase n=1 Tax=Xylona heveae (strain CBS 132557 / TC161) TaxID=1328760 RepID=A0A165IQR7_XYLHT|nr:hypothetical protein L228DRAFT_265722 [Xylona heveae TC161]KZF25246.1 hypothetical protein L228DRAFT_265722 [Xylona heveae TC161]